MTGGGLGRSIDSDGKVKSKGMSTARVDMVMVFGGVLLSGCGVVARDKGDARDQLLR